MGIYVYRVTAKKVRCSDGKLANIAVFAYKPYWGFDSDKDNAKMHFRSVQHLATPKPITAN